MTRRGCLWFAGGLMLAVVAGVLAFVGLVRVASAPQAGSEAPRVQVVVAARDLPLHTVLAAGDVMLREVPPEVIPEDALRDPKDAVGQMAISAVARDEIILARRLLKPDYVGPRVAFVMDPKKVVVAFPAVDLLSTLDVVRPGDRVDIMLSLNPGKVSSQMSGEALMTMMVLQDVRVGAVMRAVSQSADQAAGAGGAPRALLLVLDPQDALTLKYFRDNGGSADLALRSPAAAAGPFNVLLVDGAYIMQRYRLRGR